MVVSFDRLHAGYIGCFGNDWIETPHFDRLATEAVVFDQHFCENLDPVAANHAWWTGRCQFPLDAIRQRECPSFLEPLHAGGVSTCLIVESDGGNDSAIAPRFGEVITAHGIDGFDAAETDTPFARLVHRTREWLADSHPRTGPVLLWVKSRGIPSPWSPPRVFGELYLDEFGLGADVAEGDDTGGEGMPPDDSDSPDERDPASGADGSLDWRYAAAMYAAYVTLVDRGLGRLLAAVRQTPGWEGALLIVAADAGQPLGEHAPVGAERVPLRSESLQTPLWVQAPGFDQGGTRRQALVQSIDLPPTLCEWLCGTADGARLLVGESSSPAAGRSLIPLIANQDVTPRESLLMGYGRAQWAVRTPEFLYVEPGDDSSETDEEAVLFEKPHDRWDQSDVLSQYPQIAAELRARLRGGVQQLQDCASR